MINIRIVFNGWQEANFVAFSLAEAFTILQDYDRKTIKAIHIYPNKL